MTITSLAINVINIKLSMYSGRELQGYLLLYLCDKIISLIRF
jgi:hypothetical protein